MLETIAAWGAAKIAAYAGATIGAMILTWILKKIPTKKVRKAIYTAFFKIGAGISKFFNGWKYTKAIWENTLEPWLCGFLDMIGMAIMQGLFDGLNSDDK